MSSSNIQLPMVSTWDSKPSPSRKGSPSSTRSKSSSHRVSKRTSPHIDTSMSYNEHLLHSHGAAGRRGKRVWKACERCRMKKTKCDGEFPCQRCNDDGLICTASVRKRPGYKQLPSGYAEVLENTQLVLVATIRKLYEMVRNGDQWLLGEPRCNDRGQAIIHNIAQKLACIRSNGDIDLPVQSVFPEDMEGMEHLASILREQQASLEAEDGCNKSSDYFSGCSTEATSPESHSDLDHELYTQRPSSQGASFHGPFTPESIGTTSNQFGLSNKSELENYDIYPLSQLDDISYESSLYQSHYDDEISSMACLNKGTISADQFGLSAEFQRNMSPKTPEQKSYEISMPPNNFSAWGCIPRSTDDSMLRQFLQLSSMNGLQIEPDMLRRIVKPEMLSVNPEAINHIEEQVAFSGYGGF